MSTPPVATFRCEGCHAYCVVGLERLRADPDFVLDWARAHVRCCPLEPGAGVPRTPEEPEATPEDAPGWHCEPGCSSCPNEPQAESPLPEPSPEGQGTPPSDAPGLLETALGARVYVTTDPSGLVFVSTSTSPTSRTHFHLSRTEALCLASLLIRCCDPELSKCGTPFFPHNIGADGRCVSCGRVAP